MKPHRIIISRSHRLRTLHGLPALFFAFAFFGTLAYCGHHPESWTLWPAPSLIQPNK